MDMQNLRSGFVKFWFNVIRNVFESAVLKQAMRLGGKEEIDDEELVTLQLEDFS